MNANEYFEWLSKFDAKHTTDECFTPPEVYDAVADWVSSRYGLDKEKFVRPFHPDGDYKGEDYTDSVVVDNPPFSIISKITAFYVENNVPFFLFAPALTTFGGGRNCCSVCVGVGITYGNGANVATSFVTNLEKNTVIMSAPSLYKTVKAANEVAKKERTRELPKYCYPSEVVTAANVEYFSKHDTEFCVASESAEFIRKLDSQQEQKKTIFGGGYLLSDFSAAEKAAAEKAAAIRWGISSREREIISKLK